MGKLGHEEVLFRSGTMAGLSDGELLRRFLDRRDLAADVAFEAIVGRHGPMVLAACRRQLRNLDDADDAFQATFLALAKKAGSIRGDGSLGGWLHRVARHASSRARRRSALRGLSEQAAGIEASRAANPAPSIAEQDEVRQVLDEELGRLPGSFRAPFTLCYLEGLTHDEAAEQLCCPVGTVRSRLARGRDRLRARLIRRGIVPATFIVPESPFDRVADATVPPDLLNRTVAAASRVAVGQCVAARSVAAFSLMESVGRTMFHERLRAIGVGLLAAGLAGVGVSLIVDSDPKSSGQAIPTKAPKDGEVEVAGGWKDLKGFWDIVEIKQRGKAGDLALSAFDECKIVPPEGDPKSPNGSVGRLIFLRDSRLFEEWLFERLDSDTEPKSLVLASGGSALGSPGRRSRTGTSKPSPGLTRHSGIYRLGPDELTVCLSRGHELSLPPRPLKFSAEVEESTTLIRMKRRAADDPREVRRRSIQGKWEVTAVLQVGPNPLSPERGQTWEIGTDSIRWLAGNRVLRELSYKHDPTDILVSLIDPTAGEFQALRGVQDRGMTLTLCYGRTRPAGYMPDTAKGEVLVLLKSLANPPVATGDAK